jgi:hypothetical protein
MSPGEILKPREDGTRSGRTEQSGYQFKNTEHPCKIVQKPFMHHRTAGRNRQTVRKALKKITNAIKKTRNYTERDKR